MKPIFNILLFAFFILVSSCKDSEDLLVQEKNYVVASSKVDCQGIGPQKCYLIKEKDTQDWQYFYSTIIGFEHEEGFEYELLISEKEVENPPQDSSSIAYTLLKVISKIEKKSENLPN
ncbi:DUF4377 domain-containing protein [Polaribacter sp. IC073]|uniref:DUF4377 domain-containing protein n=1 Tax=Polaribacter sp. IC073 TaxID=2508540 RepID=UPI0011BDBAD8|nr:DUF4377 domain-containing protein [Polaribacter sp. IC073]TXD49900.1 DUF4377 domain-containing protein [Polaribacter sp. IC073]